MYERGSVYLDQKKFYGGCLRLMRHLVYLKNNNYRYQRSPADGIQQPRKLKFIYYLIIHF